MTRPTSVPGTFLVISLALVLSSCCAVFGIGCDSETEPDTVWDVSDLGESGLPGDMVLAYVLEGDPGVYIREGFVTDVANKMNGAVDGDSITFEEDGVSVRRGVRLLPPPPLAEPFAAGQLRIAKWVFTRGLICTRKPKGTWLPVRSAKTRRIVRWYQTQEEANWCLEAKNAECAITVKTIQGDFWTGGPGRGQKKQETRRLARCFR